MKTDFLCRLMDMKIAWINPRPILTDFYTIKNIDSYWLRFFTTKKSAFTDINQY